VRRQCGAVLRGTGLGCKAPLAKTRFGRRRPMGDATPVAELGRHRNAATLASTHPADDICICSLQGIDPYGLTADGARGYPKIGSGRNFLGCYHYETSLFLAAFWRRSRYPNPEDIVPRGLRLSGRPKVGVDIVHWCRSEARIAPPF
jgi:hypothetical protein